MVTDARKRFPASTKPDEQNTLIQASDDLDQEQIYETHLRISERLKGFQHNGLIQVSYFLNKIKIKKAKKVIKKIHCKRNQTKIQYVK